MGPLATVDFYQKLIKATPAKRDQDHLRVLIVADPSVPDRSEAILTGETEKVFSSLLAGLKRLEKAGADTIVMPCNTAHYWFDDLQQQTGVEMLSIVESSLAQVRKRVPEARTISILGTKGTLASGIYDTAIARQGLSLIKLEEPEIEKTAQTISLVKSGALLDAEEICKKVVEAVRKRSEVILLACTELPVAASRLCAGEPRLIDTTSALVETCLEWSLSDRRYSAVEKLDAS